MSGLGGKHRPRPDTEVVDEAPVDEGGVASHRRPRKLRHHAGRPTLVRTETIAPVGDRTALDDDTAGIPTFELAVPTIDQTITGYASLRQASPSLRVGTAPVPPAPFPPAEPGRDWRMGVNRAGIFAACVGTVVGWLALYRAETADEQQLASAVLAGCLVLIGAFSGWAIARPVPCRCGRKCPQL